MRERMREDRGELTRRRRRFIGTVGVKNYGRNFSEDPWHLNYARVRELSANSLSKSTSESHPKGYS